MTRRIDRFLLAFALGLFPVRARAASIHLLHQPRASVQPGQPIPIVVEVEGLGAETARVVLHHRGQGARAYVDRDLVAMGGGRFEGTVPAADTRGFAAYYWIQAGDGRVEIRLGSAAQPIAVRTIETEAPTAERQSPWYAPAIAGVALLGAATVLSRRERRRAERLEDRRFWIRTLHPLTGMRGAQVAEEMNKLSMRPLRHPVEGLQLYDRAVLARHLQEVQHLSRLMDRQFWIHTLTPLLPQSGAALAARIAQLARTSLPHPLDGFTTYTPGELLHNLEMVRHTSLEVHAAEVEAARFPGCDIDALARKGSLG